MTIRQKTGLVIFASFLLLTGVLFFLAAWILWGQFQTHETRVTRDSALRVAYMLDEEVAGLDNFAQDYGAWDDMCSFVAGTNTKFAELNLRDEPFAKYRLNFVIIFDARGKVVFSKGYDLEALKEMPVAPVVLESLTPDSAVLQLLTPRDFRAGLMTTAGGNVLLAAHPIVSSDYQLPVRGFLVVGRELNRHEVDRLSLRTKIPLSFLSFDTPEVPAAVRGDLLTTPRPRPMWLQAESRDVYAGYALLRDFNAKPVLFAKVQVSRDMYQQYRSGLRFFAIGFLVIGLLVGLASLGLLNRLVLRRISRLQTFLDSVHSTEQLGGRANETGSDEVAALAIGVNRMLAELEADTKARRDAEHALRESQVLLGQIVDLIPHPIYALAETGVFILVNRAFAAACHRPQDALPGRGHDACCPTPEQAAAFTAADLEVLRCGTPVHLPEEQFLDHNGVPRWRHLSKVPFTDRGQRAVLVVAMDITEQKNMQKSQEDLTRELACQNKEMAAFLGAVTHDMRSPLTNIHGFSVLIDKHRHALSALLQQTDVPVAVRTAADDIISAKMSGALTIIQSSTQKMFTMINGLVELARCGRVAFTPERLDMDKLMTEVLANLTFQLEQATGHVTVERLPHCVGDAKLLHQLFSNLAENAIRYRSPERPLQLTVTADFADREVIYRLTDNGIGIPPAQAERIWELFYRAEPGVSREGQGIGLALVKKIVERHGGRCWVEQAPGGQGCRFCVALEGATS